LGFRREIAAETVERFTKEYEDPYGTNRPIAVLRVVTRDPKRALRIRGANGLEPGGIERIASAIRIPVEGAW